MAAREEASSAGSTRLRSKRSKKGNLQTSPPPTASTAAGCAAANSGVDVGVSRTAPPFALPLPEWVSLWTVLWVGFLLRMVAVIYGSWQDEHFAVKYTDIDYSVFTDAARYVQRGESPFLRATYRYTPLLAHLLTPCITVHAAFGKVLFCVLDLASGALVYDVLRWEGRGSSAALSGAVLTVLNPLSIGISSRGSAESLMSTLVLAVVAAMCRGWTVTAGLVFGLAVHVKIYPLIYAPALYLALEYPSWVGMSGLRGWWLWARPTWKRIAFAAASLASFGSLTALMYFWYGEDYLAESWLYHVTRADNRHNFSVYFYLLALAGSSVTKAVALSLFACQAIAVGAAGLVLPGFLGLCFFVQTSLFVAFNKVVTAQYFMWYLSLVPLVVPSVRLSGRALAGLAALWGGGQGLWLGLAYLLEFRGVNTFLWLWFASAVFLAVNLILVGVLLTHYDFGRDWHVNKKEG